MMKIGVCVKQVYHVYARTGKEPERLFLAPEDKIFRVSPYDEWALELALRARESLGQGEVILLTLGALIAEAELRRCLAMGADRLYRIEAQGPFDPWRKSSLIARAVRELEIDLVLCGKESLDTQNGQVGAFTAHHLHRPFLSSIIDLKVQRDTEGVFVERRAGRGMREIVACRLPAVFTVDLVGDEPRLPIFEDRRHAQSKAVDTLQYGDHGEGVRTMLTRTFPPSPRPKMVPTPDSHAEAFERIDQLLAGSLVKKKGTMLTGRPEEQVEEILVFLKEHNLINTEQGREHPENDET
jgi:electron transfer flavoprotein beta subunit